MLRSRRLRPMAAATTAAALLAATAFTFNAPATGAAPTAQNDSLQPLISVGPVIKTNSNQPPTSAQCLTDYGIACYGPSDIRNQYNLPAVYATGVKGKGETIAIFDAYGSPTIQSDLHTFDQAYGLPDPPSFKVIYPEGKPQLNYANLPSPANQHSKHATNAVSWAYEVSLDVEWSHAIAPDANILLVTTPIPETQGVQGLQNLLNAEQYVLDHHLANAFTQSFGTTEQAFSGGSDQTILQRFSKLYQQAAAEGVTVFASTGDSGVANTNKQNKLFPYPTVDYPASDPYVTAVGGTEINPPPAAITTYSAESVWNDCCGAGTGGYSSVFARPSYQNGTVSNAMRGLPDVSYNAALISAINIYESFDPVYGAGWTLIGGTSAASPQWAGIAALADNYAALNGKSPVGFINPALYTIGRSTLYNSDLHDITTGNNSADGITGYTAAPGWDAATGWGTPNAANLIPDLVNIAG